MNKNKCKCGKDDCCPECCEAFGINIICAKCCSEYVKTGKTEKKNGKKNS